MHKKYKIKDSKFSKMTCNKSNTTDAICGAETAYPSGTPDFTPVLVVFVLLDRYFSV